jgi:ATP synthase protein I
MAGREDQETNRKSGLAYAAAINLFASVITLTGLGWLLDRWLETAPLFLVGGIVLGAVVGFYQFIRITSKLK